MINFIIYEDEKESRKMFKDIILKVIGTKNKKYQILEYEKYDLSVQEEIIKLDGKKIFILDIEVPGKSGLDLARYIRKELDDWESQLIIVTSHEHLKETSFMTRLLMLDFVSKFYECERHLKCALTDALNILDKNRSFSFTKNKELYQIPYSSILYIKKSEDDYSSVLVTSKTKQIVRMSISEIWKKLEKDDRFFKTSRNCIVNLSNIIKVDFTNSTIYFEKNKIKSLSRQKKKELKEQLGKRKSSTNSIDNTTSRL